MKLNCKIQKINDMSTKDMSLQEERLGTLLVIKLKEEELKRVSEALSNFEVEKVAQSYPKICVNFPTVKAILTIHLGLIPLPPCGFTTNEQYYVLGSGKYIVVNGSHVKGGLHNGCVVVDYIVVP